jgi:hypothetical protein
VVISLRWSSVATHLRYFLGSNCAGDTANIAKWVQWQGMTSLKYVRGLNAAWQLDFIVSVKGVLAYRAGVLQLDRSVDQELGMDLGRLEFG